MKITADGRGARGMMSRALGCTEGRRLPAEFWVQTAQWGQPACGQHVAGVIRRALQTDARHAVVVDRNPEGAVCYVAGALHG